MSFLESTSRYDQINICKDFFKKMASVLPREDLSIIINNLVDINNISFIMSYGDDINKSIIHSGNYEFDGKRDLFFTPFILNKQSRDISKEYKININKVNFPSFNTPDKPISFYAMQDIVVDKERIQFPEFPKSKIRHIGFPRLSKYKLMTDAYKYANNLIKNLFTHFYKQGIRCIVNLTNIDDIPKLNFTGRTSLNYISIIEDETKKMLDGITPQYIVSKKIISRTFTRPIFKYTIRLYDGKEMIVFNYPNWKDEDVCDSEDMIYLAELVKPYYENNAMAVHCTAGDGRTGTFISFCYCKYLIDNSKVIGISMEETFWKELILCVFFIGRLQRYGFIQTKEQYNLIITTVMKYLGIETKMEGSAIDNYKTKYYKYKLKYLKTYK